MAASIVASRIDALGVSGGTSGTLNLNGLNVTTIAIGIVSYTLGTKPPTVADSLSSSLTGLTAQDSSEPYVKWYYVDFVSPPSTTTYSVSVTGTSVYAGVVIVAMAGTANPSYDSTAGTDNGQNNSVTGTSVQVGSNFTPTNANEILLCILGYSLANTPTIDSSFAAVVKADYSAGANEGLAFSYQVQTTATSRQPTWSWTVQTRGVTSLIAFQSASGGGGAMAVATTGSAAVSANLTGAGTLADAITGSAAVSATLKGAGALADAMTGNAAVAATLTATGALADPMTGSAAVAATLTGSGAMICAITAGATVVAGAAGVGALVCAMTGTATVSAAMVAGAMICSIAAGSTMAASMGGAGALLCAMTGTATVTATLHNGSGGGGVGYEDKVTIGMRNGTQQADVFMGGFG